MNAKYKIQTKHKSVEFEAEALNYAKCLQIKRIMEANKRWRGYEILTLEVEASGLIYLHIRK